MPIQVTCPSCHATLKTADSSAGKRAKCPKCDGIIQIPELAPPSPAPDDEYVLDAEANPLSGFSDEELSAGTPTGDDRKPCPACGEMIVRGAVKCRFCGEIFDPVLKKKEQKAAKAGDSDAEMQTVDWLLAIFCGFIGCLFAIVYMIQGKPKGSKMLLVAILANVIWGVAQAVLVAVTKN